jgi:hypothetical protein
MFCSKYLCWTFCNWMFYIPYLLPPDLLYPWTFCRRTICILDLTFSRRAFCIPDLSSPDFLWVHSQILFPERFEPNFFSARRFISPNFRRWSLLYPGPFVAEVLYV